ncbi:hypothetical protein VP1G_10012 [Cytospora mali]|uniref:Xylanolytic transcriptional activator regulatory domain-containing protein n=1 Tax=Cytospora mali TaxID=578113 RepID=A0A194VGI4_CYTMA|nr:hypothetical protein VP1G_10012 [Valsa mali var. pyri (nom. inval.)]
MEKNPKAYSAAVSPAGFRRLIPDGDGPKSDSAIYQGIAAVHEDIESTENSRLFYGPASQFAFLQQVHRGILSSTGPHGHPDREVQEGGPGLDLFLQRSFFFGTASRVDASVFYRPASTLLPEVCLAQATLFLRMFKSWSSHILSFFSDTELDRMLHNLYSSDDNRPSQTKALTLAILALGALGTSHTDIAEILLAKAKYEAVLFDDTVSLQMIQFSLLQAEYQNNMGRPNLTYLNLGTACRKAFALGLHREAANSMARSEDTEKCRTTLWCLYYLESWYSMTVGRESSLKMSDISSPFPVNQPFIVSLSRLAYIGEQCVKSIYSQRYDSLRQLYLAAEGIHTQLREFAAKHGIGSAGFDGNGVFAISEGPASLQLHNLYYHTILLNFRPFLVADYALASSPECQSAMWLRQACRYATNTAQDCIMYSYSQLQKHEACRSSRYHGFFLESSCAVLFFDILRHPSKYPYNVEYIQMAIECLGLMVNDEPVTNARNSLKKILRIVEETIVKGKNMETPMASGLPAFADPILQTNANPTMPSPVSFMSQDHPQSHSNIQFPSLNAPLSSANQLIFFSDQPGSMGTDTNGSLTMPNLPGDPDTFAPGEGLDPLSHFHYDVVTTDLYNFFPLNMTPPSVTGNDAVSDGAGAGAGNG